MSSIVNEGISNIAPPPVEPSVRPAVFRLWNDEPTDDRCSKREWHSGPEHPAPAECRQQHTTGNGAHTDPDRLGRSKNSHRPSLPAGTGRLNENDDTVGAQH